MGKQWQQWQTLFSWALKSLQMVIIAKRLLLLGRKAITNIDSILKGRETPLLTKVHIVKATVFPAVTYGCESWTIKKTEHQRIDAFELWCWRRLLRVPWTARRSNQSILKESVLNIHWQDWCWSWSFNNWPPDAKSWLIGRPRCWERLKAGEGEDRGWDGGMASPTEWTWVWVSSGGWWRTGKPGELQPMGPQSRTGLSGWTGRMQSSSVLLCKHLREVETQDDTEALIQMCTGA